MATPNGRGGWDLTDHDVAEIARVSFGEESDEPRIKTYSEVLHLHEHQASERHVYFQYGGDDWEGREGYYMTRDRWQQLGMPSIITTGVTAGIVVSIENKTD